MAGNFRRVLIFVIFVVDLAVTKINAYGTGDMTVRDDGRGHKHRGSEAIINIPSVCK